MAATNTPETLDKALVRPGRFDRTVAVPNPDVDGRKQILATHAAEVKVAKGVDWEVIARGTPGFSGADLANLVNVAALKAALDGAKEVGMSQLEHAKDRIMMGAERKSAVVAEENRRLTAYHEGGHALVALFTEGARPIHKATIVPRGQALGMVMQLPEKDELNLTKKQLLAMLDVTMGGRVAEELIFGADEVTTGASSDLRQATRLAREMITKYGFSKSVGLSSTDYADYGLVARHARGHRGGGEAHARRGERASRRAAQETRKDAAHTRRGTPGERDDDGRGACAGCRRAGARGGRRVPGRGRRARSGEPTRDGCEKRPEKSEGGRASGSSRANHRRRRRGARRRRRRRRRRRPRRRRREQPPRRNRREANHFAMSGMCTGFRANKKTSHFVPSTMARSR